MASSKPTIVMIAGAFHYGHCQTLVTAQLLTAGYPFRLVTLKSVGDPKVGIQDDAKAILAEEIRPLLDAGREIVVVAHSYAGFPTAIFCKGNSKGERQSQGLPGGIIGLVYLAAFIPPEGASLKTMIGGQWMGWMTADEERGLITPNDTKNIFYADVEDSIVEMCKLELRPQSMKSFTEPAAAPGYLDAAYNGRRAYVRCADDHALPISAQDGMLQASGAEWLVKTMETSHSPFLSQPVALSKALQELATSFAAAA